MWITITSVGIAMVAAFVITRSVTAATKHSDRRRRERGETLPSEGGALVTVRLRTFQWVLIRVVAIVFVVVGALLSLGAATTISTGVEPSLVVMAIVLLLAGIGGVVLSRSMRRTRVLAMEDHLLVRQGLHQERRVDLGEIAAVLPIANQYGGLQARDVTGKRLFSVMGLARGYAELEAYLQERVVRPRATAQAALRPNGVPIPPWRGSRVAPTGPPPRSVPAVACVRDPPVRRRRRRRAAPRRGPRSHRRQDRGRRVRLAAPRVPRQPCARRPDVARGSTAGRSAAGEPRAPVRRAGRTGSRPPRQRCRHLPRVGERAPALTVGG